MNYKFLIYNINMIIKEYDNKVLRNANLIIDKLKQYNINNEYKNELENLIKLKDYAIILIGGNNLFINQLKVIKKVLNYYAKKC